MNLWSEDNEPKLRRRVPPFGQDAAAWARLRVRIAAFVVLFVVFAGFAFLAFSHGQNDPPEYELAGRELPELLRIASSELVACDTDESLAVPIEQSASHYRVLPTATGPALAPCSSTETCEAQRWARVRPVVVVLPTNEDGELKLPEDWVSWLTPSFALRVQSEGELLGGDSRRFTVGGTCLMVTRQVRLRASTTSPASQGHASAAETYDLDERIEVGPCDETRRCVAQRRSILQGDGHL